MLAEECVLLAIASEAAGKWLARGSPPHRRACGECAVAWIPLKAAGLNDAPKDQVGTSDLQNRKRGSRMEKLPFGAVTSRNGITECRNTEFDIRWKCSKVIRVAKLNGFRILRTQQRALSQCHFLGMDQGFLFLGLFLVFSFD